MFVNKIAENEVSRDAIFETVIAIEKLQNVL